MPKHVKDYPRPQLRRENYQLLDGIWNFSFDRENLGESQGWYNDLKKDRDILVPFTYETTKSGIGEETACENVWYSRTLTIDKARLDQKILLHFEGSDYHTKVWVNSQYVGEHIGGYSRFSFDITGCAKEGENVITVKVEDDYSTFIPRGKQRWVGENFACWYVQTTGIWKTVWLEYVENLYIENLKITPSITDGTVIIEGRTNKKADNETATLTVSFNELEINKMVVQLKGRNFYAKMDVKCSLFPTRILTWNTESPNLYDLSVELSGGDSVVSYFGMREIRIRGNNILLNGRPIYQRLILDQGYWEESHLTPPSEDALVEDIDKIMALGYNGLRKHQKVEDERFLYWCDVKGMLVWCEMPSNYSFSDVSVEAVTTEWMDIVLQNYNHPSIITWTPVNESWGVTAIENDYQQQKFTEAIYNITKSIDAMRPVIVNDGWEHTVSDIITIHDYEASGSVFFEKFKNPEKILSNEDYFNYGKSAFAEGYGYKGQPIIISEYGGIAFSDGNEGWGYGDKVEGEEAFIKRFADITNAIKALDYCCGFCYTQVTDVQQEINGLMDIRRNFKVSSERIKEINEQIISTYDGAFESIE